MDNDNITFLIAFFIFIGMLLFLTLFGAVITLFIWNVAIAPLFHVSTITLLQAVAINLILQVIRSIIIRK